MNSLAVSNIGWKDPFDSDILRHAVELGVTRIEVAPLKSFGAIENFEWQKVSEFVEFISGCGLNIFAFQSLLFGAGELYIFKTEDFRQRLTDILRSQFELAGKIGVVNLIYGSPGTRKLSGRTREEAISIAVDFFGSLGELAAECGTNLSIEPNPAGYGNEFLQTTSEVVEFVKLVNSPGLKAHIDSGAIIMNNEDTSLFTPEIMQFNGHIHVSNPLLSPPSSNELRKEHEILAELFHDVAPDKILSLEVKQVEPAEFKECVSWFTRVYGRGA